MSSNKQKRIDSPDKIKKKKNLSDIFNKTYSDEDNDSDEHENNKIGDKISDFKKIQLDEGDENKVIEEKEEKEEKTLHDFIQNFLNNDGSVNNKISVEDKTKFINEYLSEFKDHYITITKSLKNFIEDLSFEIGDEDESNFYIKLNYENEVKIHENIIKFMKNNTRNDLDLKNVISTIKILLGEEGIKFQSDNDVVDISNEEKKNEEDLKKKEEEIERSKNVNKMFEKIPQQNFDKSEEEKKNLENLKKKEEEEKKKEEEKKPNIQSKLQFHSFIKETMNHFNSHTALDFDSKHIIVKGVHENLKSKNIGANIKELEIKKKELNEAITTELNSGNLKSITLKQNKENVNEINNIIKKHHEEQILLLYELMDLTNQSQITKKLLNKYYSKAIINAFDYINNNSPQKVKFNNCIDDKSEFYTYFVEFVGASILLKRNINMSIQQHGNRVIVAIYKDVKNNYEYIKTVIIKSLNITIDPQDKNKTIIIIDSIKKSEIELKTELQYKTREKKGKKNDKGKTNKKGGTDEFENIFE